MEFLIISITLFIIVYVINKKPTLLYKSNKWWSQISPEKLEKLIKKGADINATNNSGITPLMCAASASPNPKIIELLLMHGANIKARDTVANKTPLIFAALRNQNPDVVKVLVNHGADINEKDRFGFSPLIQSIQLNPNIKVIKAIIELGAYFDIKTDEGCGILTYSANRPDVLELLIKNNPDINFKYKHGITPLMNIAFWTTKDQSIATLIKYGADVNAKDDEGKTPLMYASNTPISKSPEIFEVFVNNGVDMNVRDYSGKTALSYALENDNQDTVFLLKKYGAI